jgi:hypothetical protein
VSVRGLSSARPTEDNRIAFTTVTLAQRRATVSRAP